MFSFSADKWSAAGDQTFVSTAAFLIKLQIYFQHTFPLSNISSPSKLLILKKLLLRFQISHIFTTTATTSPPYKLSLQLLSANFLFLLYLFTSNTPKLSFSQIFSPFSLSPASLVQIESFIADLIWSAPQSSSSHHHCRALICTFDSCTNCTIKSALKLSDKNERKI